MEPLARRLDDWIVWSRPYRHCTQGNIHDPIPTAISGRPRGLHMFQSADTVTFLRAWLANPLSVGAVAPSSKRLACLITSELDSCRGPVLELGPGTGVFTDALIRRGVPERELTLVELGVEFAELLSARYPQAAVLRKDAAHLFNHQPPCGSRYAVVISGLPLLSLPSHSVMRILARVFALSRADAALYQFTYGWRCPVLGCADCWQASVRLSLDPWRDAGVPGCRRSPAARGPCRSRGVRRSRNAGRSRRSTCDGPRQR